MPDADRPNIVFFFTDDQRFDTLGALGNPWVITPNIDALAAAGTSFRRAYIMGGSRPAVCMPSRAMLMTGRTLFHIDREGQDILPEHVMLGECLQRAGYVTCGIGKWHNGRSAYARSFSTGARIFFGGMWNHFEVPINDFDPDGAYPEDRIYRETGTHSSDLFATAAADFLADHAGRGEQRPFFLYVSFLAPHDPRDTHPQYHRMYDPDELPTPENFLPRHPFDNGELTIRDEKLAPWPRTPEIVRKHLADYYAMITHADDAIGRVVRALKDNGLYDNTVIVFSGDNGLGLGRHGLMGKQNVYDHSVHVPLIFAGPGVPAGRSSDACCYLLDIYPTLCDLAGLAVPESVEGRSLVPAMRDPGEGGRETMLFAYRHVQRSAMDAQFKLIEYVVEGRRTRQLFDLLDDPFERTNLIDQAVHREHARRLGRQLARWQSDFHDPCAAFWQTCRPE